MERDVPKFKNVPFQYWYIFKNHTSYGLVWEKMPKLGLKRLKCKKASDYLNSYCTIHQVTASHGKLLFLYPLCYKNICNIEDIT